MSVGQGKSPGENVVYMHVAVCRDLPASIVAIGSFLSEMSHTLISTGSRLEKVTATESGLFTPKVFSWVTQIWWLSPLHLLSSPTPAGFLMHARIGYDGGRTPLKPKGANQCDLLPARS